MKLLFKNKVLNLDLPAVMGILNLTPDSFFDGGKYKEEAAILRQTEKMLLEGAAIIDIGACSTRPNAEMISEEDELKRLLPALKQIRKKFPDAILSVDTFRSNVAVQAVGEGADMINDISGGMIDPTMFETIGKMNVPYVLTHIKGTPETMQKAPHYNDLLKEVKDYFREKISALKKLGVDQIILDPGFGFGKTVEHNYALLKNLSVFKEFGLPILAGMSRKGMITKVLGNTPEAALNGTTAVNTIALLNGAAILRVHDVKEAKEAVTLVQMLQG